MFDRNQPYEPVDSNNNNNNNEADAYPAVQSSWSKRICMLVGILLTLIILRNAFFVDYDNETKDYLRSQGRTDIIDSLYPKTKTEIANDKKSQADTIAALIKNVTALQSQYKDLAAELEALKDQPEEPSHNPSSAFIKF